MLNQTVRELLRKYPANTIIKEVKYQAVPYIVDDVVHSFIFEPYQFKSARIRVVGLILGLCSIDAEHWVENRFLDNGHGDIAV